MFIEVIDGVRVRTADPFVPARASGSRRFRLDTWARSRRLPADAEVLDSRGQAVPKSKWPITAVQDCQAGGLVL